MKQKAVKISNILAKGVEQILPSRQGLAALMEKRKIRLYVGIDPTSSKLHVGHSIPLRKLQEFVNLGHEVILVFGTGTVLAGDPSLRGTARRKITEEEIRENIKTWKGQAGKILDFSRVETRKNGDWLLKLKLGDVLNIASRISAARLFQREMFQKRLNRGDTVWTSEILYPLLQGYDSVVLEVDLEIGGSDQVFNMLVGRELIKKMKGKEKFVMTLPMILGTDGKTMSKSSGNCIWLDDSPDQMYGKTMSIPDSLIASYFENLTNVPIKDIREYEREIKAKKRNPSELKKRLAFEIVKIYHGRQKALKAEKEFNKVFKERKVPSKVPGIFIEKGSLNILDLIVGAKLAPSKAEAKRLIEQGGVKIDGQVQKDWRKTVETKKGMLIQVGKRKFVKIA